MIYILLLSILSISSVHGSSELKRKAADASPEGERPAKRLRIEEAVLYEGSQIPYNAVWFPDGLYMEAADTGIDWANPRYERTAYQVHFQDGQWSTADKKPLYELLASNAQGHALYRLDAKHREHGTVTELAVCPIGSDPKEGARLSVPIAQVIGGVSPSGRRLAIASKDSLYGTKQLVTLYQKDEKEKKWKEHTSIVASSEGDGVKLLFWSGEERLVVATTWECKLVSSDGKELAREKSNHGLSNFFHNGAEIVLREHVIRVCDDKLVVSKAPFGYVEGCAWNPQGTQVATYVKSGIFAKDYDHTIVVWDIARDKDGHVACKRAVERSLDYFCAPISLCWNAYGLYALCYDNYYKRCVMRLLPEKQQQDASGATLPTGSTTTTAS